MPRKSDLQLVVQMLVRKIELCYVTEVDDPTLDEALKVVTQPMLTQPSKQHILWSLFMTMSWKWIKNQKLIISMEQNYHDVCVCVCVWVNFYLVLWVFLFHSVRKSFAGTQTCTAINTAIYWSSQLGMHIYTSL